jgi:hypothetical protein
VSQPEESLSELFGDIVKSAPESIRSARAAAQNVDRGTLYVEKCVEQGRDETCS